MNITERRNMFHDGTDDERYTMVLTQLCALLKKNTEYDDVLRVYVTDNGHAKPIENEHGYIRAYVRRDGVIRRMWYDTNVMRWHMESRITRARTGGKHAWMVWYGARVYPAPMR